VCGEHMEGSYNLKKAQDENWEMRKVSSSLRINLSYPRLDTKILSQNRNINKQENGEIKNGNGN